MGASVPLWSQGRPLLTTPVFQSVLVRRTLLQSLHLQEIHLQGKSTLLAHQYTSIMCAIFYTHILCSITDFNTISPFGLTLSAVTQSQFNSTHYYSNVTWTPSQSQYGEPNQFSFSARNSEG